jgi:5'-methylthioinosine phosphorylase
MSAPTPTGERLGLVFGHSLARHAFADRGSLVSAGPAGTVEALDCGDFVALSRHGHSHFVPAHLIDHHATITALAELGCNRLVALASTGSLHPDWAVGTIVAPDDFLGLQVAPSFFDDARGHTVPGFDPEWRSEILAAWRAVANPAIVDGGVYAQTPGPRFESPAEVRMLASFGDLVGMTLIAEAVLAREAGIRYAAICSVDNLANGLDDEPLTVEVFQANKAANEERMARATEALIARLLEEA